MASQIDLPPVHQPPMERRGLVWALTPAWLQALVRAFTLLRHLTESGTTANRPTVELWVGRPYFNTTTGAIEHWNGSAWV